MTVTVQTAAFDPGVVMAGFSAGCGPAGAVASFVGVCRPGNAGRRVTAMTLEHYPGMTERCLQRLEREAGRRWGLIDSLILHRVGRLVPGEAIVMVCTAAEHRRAAFAACCFLMDRLKTEAPFWKQEETPEGVHWVAPRDEDGVAAARWAHAET